MGLMKWLRPEAEKAKPSPAHLRRVTPAAPMKAAPAPAEEIPLDARTLVAAWRPGESRLVIRTEEPVGEGRRVALKLLGDVGVTAPVLGTVTVARAIAGAYTAEIEVDADRRPALRRVLEFLNGKATLPRTRAPRFRVTMPVVVSLGSSHVYMTSFSLSRGGCGLVWSGTRPPLGANLEVRLGSGVRAATFRARVCWVRPEPLGVKVGLRFLAGGDQPALGAILGEVKDLEART